MTSGATGGWICSLSIFQPPHALFRDDDHFFEMKDKYPKSYLKGCDENYEDAREGFNKIKEILTQKRSEMKGNQEQAIEELVTEIWKSRGVRIDDSMNERQVQGFFMDYIKQFDGSIELNDQAFDQIFKILDTDMDGNISRTEMIGFITNFTKS